MISTINNYFSERSYWLALSIGLLTIVTLALTLLPMHEVMPSKIWSYDKLGHLVIFGTWTFLVGYYRHIVKPGTLNLFYIFFVGVLFGIGIEILQYALPLNRTADFFDVAYDSVGCFIAILALYKIIQSE